VPLGWKGSATDVAFVRGGGRLDLKPNATQCRIKARYAACPRLGSGDSSSAKTRQPKGGHPSHLSLPEIERVIGTVLSDLSAKTNREQEEVDGLAMYIGLGTVLAIVVIIILLAWLL
jgi:hypothetical protein